MMKRGENKEVDPQASPRAHTHLNTESLVDGQNLEHEGEVPLLLQISEVVWMGLQELNQENTGVALFRSLYEVSRFGHHTARAVRVRAHPQLGVCLVLVDFEALSLAHLELRHPALSSSLPPGIALRGGQQSPHGEVWVGVACVQKNPAPVGAVLLWRPW